MFKLDSRSSGRRTTSRRPGQQGGAVQAQDDLLQMDMGGAEGGAIVASEITVTSNASTNSLMVMAPKEAMELIERFIDDLKELERPQFVTKTYDLENADATEVVPQLEELFGGSRKAQGRRASQGQEGSFDPTAASMLQSSWLMPAPTRSSSGPWRSTCPRSSR